MLKKELEDLVDKLQTEILGFKESVFQKEKQIRTLTESKKDLKNDFDNLQERYDRIIEAVRSRLSVIQVDIIDPNQKSYLLSKGLQIPEDPEITQEQKFLNYIMNEILYRHAASEEYRDWRF